MPDQIIHITKTGAYIKYEQLCGGRTYNPLTELKKYFTIRTKIIGERFVTNRQYKINVKISSIRVPRFGLFELMSDKKKASKCGLTNPKVISCLQPGLKPETPFRWRGSYKDNQELVAEHILKNIYSKDNMVEGKAGLILNLEAGQGKTFVAMGLINELQVKTLVVVHSETVLYDWAKETTRLFPENKIGFYFGKKKLDGDIVIGIVDSLTRDSFLQITEKDVWGHKRKEKTVVNLKAIDFFAQFGFIIFDECHLYLSQAYSQIFWQAQSQYMLGLSATPNDRPDKFDPVAWWGIGNVLEAKKLAGYTEENIPFKGKVRMIKYMAPPEYTTSIINETLHVVQVSSTLNKVITDPRRLIMICREAQRLYEKKLYIFIFADRREYLTEIKNKLIEFNLLSEILDKDNKIIRLVGGSSSEDMKAAEAQSRIILTTYQYMGTGKSIPKMNSIILATPRKSKSRQTIGRIFRLGSNYDIEREIIDIVDWATVFKSQWYKRKLFYKEKGFPITENIIHYDDIDIETGAINIDNIIYSDSDSEPDELQTAITNLKDLMHF